MVEGIINYYKKLFSGKKILVFVPHPDDEINLFGNLMDTITASTDAQITVVYFTNGNYYGMPIQRLIEAKNAIHRLCNNKFVEIVYLGYPEADFLPIVNGKSGVAIAVDGITHTYGMQGIDEYHKRISGVHAALSFENMVYDIRKTIEEYAPDYVFANLEDGHPAHILLSRIIDTLQNEYKAICFLRGFCYETAWTAPRDFYNINPYSCKRGRKTCIDDDLWDKRIRFPVIGACNFPLLFRNKLARALVEHTSQGALGAAKSVINGDAVYWTASHNDIDFDYMKILINGDFVYSFYIDYSEQKLPISLYVYEHNSVIKMMVGDRFVLESSPNVEIKEGFLCIPKGKKDITITVKDTVADFIDHIKIVRRSRIFFKLYKVLSVMEQAAVRLYLVVLKHSINKLYHRRHTKKSIWNTLTNYDQ